MKKQLRNHLETLLEKSTGKLNLAFYLMVLFSFSFSHASYGLNVSISGPSTTCPGQPSEAYTAVVTSDTGLSCSYSLYWLVALNGTTVIRTDPDNPMGTFTMSGNSFIPTFPNVQGNYTVSVSVGVSGSSLCSPSSASKSVGVFLKTPAPLVGSRYLCAGSIYSYTADGTYGDFNCNFHHYVESAAPSGWTFTRENAASGGWTLIVPSGTPTGTYEIKYRGIDGPGGHPAGATPWSVLTVHVNTPSIPVTTSDDRTPQESGYQYHTAVAELLPNTSPSNYSWYYEDSNGNPGSLITTGLNMSNLPIPPCSNVYYQLRVTINTGCASTAVYRGYAYNTNCGYYSYTASPNPATDELTIEQTKQGTESRKETIDNEINIKLLNKHGEVVLSKNSKATKTYLNVKTLQNGTYYLTIMDTKGNSLQRQIIINH